MHADAPTCPENQPAIALPRSRIGRQPGRLAVLVSPTDIISPSSFSTLKHFAEVGARHGLTTQLIGRYDLARLAEFDGLFIRQTTSIGGVAHRFAIAARELAMPVIDDPQSILRGSNKIVQHQLMKAQAIPMPRTHIVAAAAGIVPAALALGLPLVLKVPDGCYCRGVERADTMVQAEEVATRLLAFTSRIMVQEYLPTAFDWRIGLLAGRPLFACKYHMVPGHWQVVARGSKGSLVNGAVEPVALPGVPAGVIRLAQLAAGCIGRGLYGVDIKETAPGPVVIEVNDNPDMDTDAETVANPEAWNRLATWFARGIAAAAEQGRAAAIS